MKSLLLGSVALAGLAAAAAACPDPGQAPNGQVAYSGGALDGAVSLNLMAGGTVDARRCGSIAPVNSGGFVAGFFISNPDLSVDLSAMSGRDLVLTTNSPDPSCDTVLLARAPDGRWYWNDDAQGLQSRIVVPTLSAGRLDIWMGTFSGALCPTVLTMQASGGAPVPGGDGKPPADAAPQPVQPQPQPVQPQPVQPQPVQPQPVQPQPVQPQPQPVQPEPDTPDPVDTGGDKPEDAAPAPEPARPQPIAPEPDAPRPVSPEPVAPADPVPDVPDEAAPAADEAPDPGADPTGEATPPPLPGDDGAETGEPLPPEPEAEPEPEPEADAAATPVTPPPLPAGESEVSDDTPPALPEEADATLEDEGAAPQSAADDAETGVARAGDPLTVEGFDEEAVMALIDGSDLEAPIRGALTRGLEAALRMGDDARLRSALTAIRAQLGNN